MVSRRMAIRLREMLMIWTFPARLLADVSFIPYSNPHSPSLWGFFITFWLVMTSTSDSPCPLAVPADKQSTTAMSSQHPPIRLEDSFGHIVGSAAGALARRLQRNFRNADLEVTVEQWGIMVSLWNLDGQYQQELSVCTGKDKPSITRLVDNMEKRELVMRQPDESDRRLNRVFLTPRGREMLLALNEQAQVTLREALHAIDPRKLEITQEVLRLVICNLNRLD